MSLTRKDVLEMNRDDLVVLLNDKGIQYADHTSQSEMQQLYLDKMEASTSECCDDQLDLPTWEKVKQMDMLELCDRLDQELPGIEYDHLESLLEMQELYYQSMHETASEPCEHQQHQPMIGDIVENDLKMRLGLSAIYDELMEFLNQREHADSIKSIMDAMHREFNTQSLATFKDELMNGECPIVVAGETSAGKSSLINLILGEDVLAYSLLGTTSTICRLHNSDTEYVEILLDNDKVEKVDRPAGTWKAALEPYVTRRNPACKQEYVTIVDTPGIGETDELTDVLLSYLPKAVAFIYVLNSANSGGIQDDYILRILNQQKDWAKEGRPTAIDYESTIFVCNKWDRVLDDSEKVWDNARTKILHTLPGFPVDKNMYKMSVAEENRRRRSGLPKTPRFRELIQGIRNLVAFSMKGKIRKHYIWIKIFMKRIHSQILSRIENRQLSEKVRNERLMDARKQLDKLSKDVAKMETTLLMFAKEECHKLVSSLDTYLRREDVREKVLSWKKSDLSTMVSTRDDDMFRYQADRAVKARIQDVLNDWETQSTCLKDASANFQKQFRSVCQDLGKECHDFNLLLDGKSKEHDSHKLPENSILQIMVDISPSVKTTALVSLRKRLKWLTLLSAGMSVAGIALVVTGGVVGLVVGGATFLGIVASAGVLPALYAGTKADFLHIQKNKSRYMRTLAQNVLDTVSSNTTKYIFEVYFEAFETRIKSLCSVAIPNEVAADRILISNILEDARSPKAIEEEYKLLLNKIILIRKRLCQFNELEFMNAETPMDLALD